MKYDGKGLMLSIMSGVKSLNLLYRMHRSLHGNFTAEKYIYFVVRVGRGAKNGISGTLARCCIDCYHICCAQNDNLNTKYYFQQVESLNKQYPGPISICVRWIVSLRINNSHCL